MKKVLAIVMAVVMLATIGGVALAAVDPAEVHIVLPDGATANITKTVDAGGSGLSVNASVVLADPGLDVDWDINPVVSGGDNISSFQELISITTDPSVGEPLYATVNFTVGSTVVGTQTISVSEGNLDIKPGSFPNSINNKGRSKKGVIAVALLGTATFDVRTANVTTLNFGPDRAEPAHNLLDPVTYEDHIQDVNFDGHDDLVSHYITKDTGLTKNDDFAYLYYYLNGGISELSQYDSVNVIKD